LRAAAMNSVSTPPVEMAKLGPMSTSWTDAGRRAIEAVRTE
jgi:hypothetical protein